MLMAWKAELVAPFFALACLLIGIEQGCGTEVGNPKKPGKSKVADDQEAATYIVSSNISEVATAVSEELSGAQVALAPGDVAGLLGQPRVCTEANGDVTITESNEVSNVDQVTRKIGVVKRTTSDSFNITRRWQNAGEAVRCNGSGDGTKFTPKLFTSASLVIDLSLKRTIQVDLERRGGSTFLQKKTLEVKGEREITWSLAQSGPPVRVDKTVKTDVARSLVYLGRGGETKAFESRVFTDKDSPVIVQVYYDTGAWTRRVIQSGQLVSSQRDDSVVTLKYADVEYTRSGGCVPVGGKISGQIYREGELMPAMTFEVYFSADGGVIKYSNGNEEEYIPERCAMDR